MPTIKKNAQGQIYPWAIDGKNFAAYEAEFKFSGFIIGFAGQLGKDDEMIARNEEWEEGRLSENERYVEECEKGLYAGGKMNGEDCHISLGSSHQGYSKYIKPSQMKDWQKRYEKDADISKDACKMLRDQYAGKLDEKSKHLNERANEVADYVQMYTEMYDPKAGNIVEAETRTPYLYYLNSVTSGAPRFDTIGVEKCVNGLEQSGVEGGKSIFDDYMTMMTSGARETKLQYKRQKMEATGWDAKKEAQYLKKLRFEHQKTVEAFDRLWEVDDHKQYDSVLNSPLDHMIGKDHSNIRDMNYAVGFLRGEMQGIDLGYDSRHLNTLGRIGAQEQELKKSIYAEAGFLKVTEEAARKNQLEEKDPEKKKMLQEKFDADIKAIKEKQKKMQEYQRDLNELKNKIWNKRVNNVAEMEANDKLVDDFFAEHHEKYHDIQSRIENSQISLDYDKQIAKESPVVGQTKPTLKYQELQPLGNSMATITAQGFDPNAYMKFAEIANKSKTTDDGMLSPSTEQQVKSMAGEVSENLERKTAELDEKAKQYPSATGFQKALLEANKIQLNNIRRGISMEAYSPVRDASLGVLTSLQAFIDTEAFDPKNIEKTEKAVKEIGFDEFGKKALNLQKLHQNFELNKDLMSPAERRKAYRELNAAKEDMIKFSQEAYDKLANPSEEMKYLTVKDSQLQDIRGLRGFKGIVNVYSRDLMKVDVPQADEMKKALQKFNTARSSVFKKESDQHKKMREAAERVEKDMEQLQKGTVKDKQTGKDRTMTKAEKESLMKDAWEHVKTLDKMADNYIEHATENGTKTPHTPAGKSRLAGAREMKSLATQLKEHLGAQPELEETSIREKRDEMREAKYGKSVAKQLSDMDREVDKFRNMSQVQFHDSSAEARGFGLNDCEYQAARVIAIATATQELEKGKLDPAAMKANITDNTKKIANNVSFQNWVKDLSDHPEQMKELGQKSLDDIKAAFVDGMAKELEKKQELKKDGLKKEQPVKEEPKKEDKKAEKKNHKKPEITKEELVV